jgi:tetratricopeptide (TPR) repeat protein
MNMGRLEEALKEYQTFEKEYKNNSLLMGLVHGRMGYLYASLGKQSEAIKAFEQSESLTGPSVATYELARLYEATGNTAESQKKFKVVSEKLAGTAWAVEAMGKVQKIEPQPAAVSSNGGGEKEKSLPKSK